MSTRAVCRSLVYGCALAKMVLCPSMVDAATSSEQPATTGESELPAAAVELRVIGGESALASLQRALNARPLGTTTLSWSSRSHFDPRDLLSVGPAPRAEPLNRTIRCWIDLTDWRLARLYFVDPNHDRFMLRELALESEWSSFDAESVAQIVETSLTAMLSDDSAGVSRSEAQRLLAPPVDSLPSPTRQGEVATPQSRSGSEFPKYALGVTGSYGIRSYSNELPWVMGPSLALSAMRMTAVGLTGFEVAATYELPRSFEGPFAGVQLSAWALRLRVLHHIPMRSDARLWIGLHAAMGFDIVHAVPTPGSVLGNYQLVEAQNDTPFVVSSGANWLVWVTDHVALRLLLSFEVTPRPVQHSLVVDGADRELTEARYFRPSAQLGVTVR